MKKPKEEELPSRWSKWNDLITNADGQGAAFRSIILNALLVVVMVLSIPILIREMTDDRVLIAPLAVPASIVETGLDGTVAANRLWDAWTRLNHEVAVAKETRDALPSSERITFSIPDSGLSFDSFIHHLRAMIGMPETTVTGELVCTADPCTFTNAALRLRINGRSQGVIQLPQVGNTTEELYWRNAMAEVLLKVDPVRGILATRLVNDGKDGVNERAISELRKLARSHHSESDWALAYAGNLLGEDGDYEAARASFDEALKRNPRFAFAWRLRSNVAMNQKDYSEAKSAIEKAIAIDARDIRSYILLGIIEDEMLQPAAARAAFQKAMDVDPNSANPHVLMARQYLNDKKLVEARQELQIAVEIDPDFIDARETLALAASVTDQVDQAIKQQMVVVRLKPNDGEALSKLGNFLYQKGDFKAAVETYKKAQVLEPTSAKFQQLQGKASERMELFQDALIAYQTAEQLNPEIPEIWFNIGEAQRKLNNKDASRVAYLRYLSLEPQGIWVNFAKKRLEELSEGQ